MAEPGKQAQRGLLTFLRSPSKRCGEAADWSPADRWVSRAHGGGCADPRAVVSLLPEPPSEDLWLQGPSTGQTKATLLLWTPSFTHHLIFLASLPWPASIRGTSGLSPEHTASAGLHGKGTRFIIRKPQEDAGEGAGRWGRGSNKR